LRLLPRVLLRLWLVLWPLAVRRLLLRILLRLRLVLWPLAVRGLLLRILLLIGIATGILDQITVTIIGGLGAGRRRLSRRRAGVTWIVAVGLVVGITRIVGIARIVGVTVRIGISAISIAGAEPEIKSAAVITITAVRTAVTMVGIRPARTHV